MRIVPDDSGLTPYAKTVALNPFNTPSKSGFDVCANTVSCVESIWNTLSKT